MSGLHRPGLFRFRSFAAWREGDHDDLVLALALALHVAVQPKGSVAFAGGWSG